MTFDRGAVPSAVAVEVADRGWAAVPGLLEAAVLAPARAALDAVFAAEDDIAADRGWATEVHRVAYALPAKDRLFVDLFTDPAVVAVAAAVLGDDCVLAGANGLDLPPGSPGQGLHRDHPVPTPGWTAYLHVVAALDDFTADNGATVVVDASHREPRAEIATGELADAARAVPIAAGDAVCFDGAVVHAAGPNRTGSRRRALHAFFARPWVMPHWDFPATLPEDVAASLDDRQRRLFGFDARPRRWDPATRRVHR
ncbi:MAG: hypothetical protein GXY13_11570 [Acidimicrobiales bacterium]|nr:hypothetical protein [Acidimicrobiales bacterium]